MEERNLSRREGEKTMKALDEMVGKKVVVESFYHKEIHGMLSSVEELGAIIDRQIFVPMRAIFRIYLEERFEDDKKKEALKQARKKEEMQNKFKSNDSITDNEAIL
jgi:small nuclear ribonucleoprotein (snRNP)-like protein